jgi:hypothetical protein
MAGWRDIKGGGGVLLFKGRLNVELVGKVLGVRQISVLVAV